MGISSKVKSSAIFLDRDGVINRSIVRSGKPYPPSSLRELEILPGVSDSLTSLKAMGYLLIVITNQPDVARGKTRMEDVEALNSELKKSLPLDAFFICYHDIEDNCKCRKPKPGLILDAAKEFNIDLSTSYMVGDRWKDIEAGYLVGCKTFFLDYNYNEKQPEKFDYKVKSLTDVVQIIIQTHK